MKIRTDFVTNSSSSSFIILTTRENYYKVLEDLHPAYQALAKHMFKSTTAFGKKCMTASTMDGNGWSWSEFFDFDYSGDYPDDIDPDDFPWQGFDKICKLLEEGDEDNTFTHSQSGG